MYALRQLAIWHLVYMATKKENQSVTAHRFSGRGGYARFVDAIAEQFVVAGDRNVAERIARKSEIKTYLPNDDLMIQGGEDTDLFLILGGSVQILVNGREIGRRHAGEHVGEMALLDIHALRSATARALERTVTARISEHDFARIATKVTNLWRRLALTLAQRLRERSKFHAAPRELPAVFIGSSTEGLEIAECVYSCLRRWAVVPRLWAEGVFECSKTTIEDLIREAGSTDFAIIVLTADDMTRSRGNSKPSPRDNVLFELGLFMGALSRERTYILAPHGLELKIPTDLLGLTFLTYRKHRRIGLANAMRKPLKILKRQIEKYGPR